MNSTSTLQRLPAASISASLPFLARLLPICVGVILSFSALHLDAQAFSWAQQISGSGFQETRDMALDPAGNIFVIGTFEGTAAIGGVNVQSVGIFDVFFAKYNASGNLIWAKRIGGTGVDIGYGVALDAEGNVYIAGNFTGTSDFDPSPGTTHLTSTGSFDAFLAKYDASGNLVWAHHMGGGAYEEARCIAVDEAADNVVIAGIFNDKADFDPATPDTAYLQAVAGSDIYFARYTLSGDFLWAKQVGGPGSERVLDVDIDGLGGVYLAGHFQETVDFDPSDAVSERSVAGDSDLFFAKYDDAGDLIWARSAGGFFYEEANGIEVDGFGNVYIIGRYAETVDFDPGTGFSEHTSLGINDVFFAKYAPDGDLIWSKSIGGEDNDLANCIEVDSLGNIYLSGQFINTADFDPDAAAMNNLTSSGDFDIFLAQYDASGQLVWAKNIGGVQVEESTAIALDAQRNVLLTGFFNGDADFDPGSETHALNSLGEEDCFIARYSTVVVGVQDVATFDVQIYPVPATDALHIVLPESSESARLTVFDPSGKLQVTQQVRGERPVLDLSGFQAGMYYLRINAAKGTRSIPFQVVR